MGHRQVPPLLQNTSQGLSLGEECYKAFKQLKEYLVNLPLLSQALVREEARVQRPIYYTSRALHGAEARYIKIKQLAFVLVTSARRLCPYFQSHTIRVITNYPLK